MSLGVSQLFGAPKSLRRRYTVATVLFMALVLGIILLFGHIIAGSLSRRYLEDMLVAGRQDAEMIAHQIGDGEPDAPPDAPVRELRGFSRRREELFRTLEGIAQREIVEVVEVYDRNGERMFVSELRSTERVPEDEVAHLELRGALSDRQTQEAESEFSIAVPIGEIGEVVLHMSRVELEERVGRLRAELLERTLFVAVLTLLTLMAAFGLIWFLIQKNLRLEARHVEERELAALGTLAANLAHEIRNPLNSINLNLEMVEEDLGASDRNDAVGALLDTRTEVNRLGRLVTDFLTYARPTKPKVAPVDLVDLVERVRSFLAAESRARGVRLRTVGDEPHVEVLGDVEQLRQVLINLVLNAVQAVQDLETERQVVDLRVKLDGGDAVVSVSDRGNGVAEDELDHIREAFFTKRRGGSGLGLAIADRVVRGHAGELVLLNLMPFGFEARIVLPLLEEDDNMNARSTDRTSNTG